MSPHFIDPVSNQFFYENSYGAILFVGMLAIPFMSQWFSKKEGGTRIARVI